MKKIILNTFLVALVLGVASCQDKLDENASAFKNAAYMSEDVKTISVDRKLGGQIEVESRLASVAEQDERVTVTVNDFLERYNKENATNFKMLPASEVELYEIENPKNRSSNGTISITIPKGKVASRFGVRVGVLDSDKYPLGVKFVIPLSITSSSANQILSNNKTVVSLQRQVVTSVAHVKDGFAPKIKLDPEISESEEFTMQAFFMFDSFRAYSWGNYNMSLISYNWYSRINQTDINLADTTREFAAEGVEIKPYHWYQATYVHTKDHKVKIYLNGKHIRTFIRPNVVLKGGTTMSIFNPQTSYSVPHILREVRVWNKALTEAQINADLYNPIDPDTEGLVAYLPIDGEKNKYNDVTKYNNVVELHKATNPSPRGIQDGSNYHKVVEYEEYEITWHHNVIFPSETLQKVEP